MDSTQKRKIKVLTIALSILMAALTLRTVWMILEQGSSSDGYTNPSVAQRVVRGSIFDRYGNVIAIETPYYALAFHLDKMTDVEGTARAVAERTDLEVSGILETVAGHTRYALIKRRLTTRERELLEQLSLKGLVIEKRYGRQYPQVHHAASLVGFANRENEGMEGLELFYEDRLNPIPGINEKVTYGDDIYLTLDMNLQYIVDDAVLHMVQDHAAQSGTAILLDAHSGAILAASSYPWFDPNSYNLFSAAERKEQISSLIREPGSVFKVFTLAALIDAGYVNESDHFFCDGTYEYITESGNIIKINCTEEHGEVTPETMISKSCNGAVASWSKRMSEEELYSYLENYGFLTAHEISLPFPSSGYLAGIDDWSERTKPTLSFGQEIAVSPVQLAAAATTLAGDGNLLEPYLVEAILSHDGEQLYRAEIHQSSEQVVNSRAIALVREGMEEAVLTGTATPTAVEGVRIGAKTGTAQVADPDGGGYLKDTYLASTIALFPLENPRFIIYTAALAPRGGTIWGSAIAAPAISEVIRDMVRSGYIQSSVMESVIQSETESGD